jgi:hypothetical protein
MKQKSSNLVTRQNTFSFQIRNLISKTLNNNELMLDILSAQNIPADNLLCASPRSFFFFQQNTGEIAQMLWFVIDLLGGT